MAIPTLSGSYIDETYIRLVQVSGSEFADGLGNPISFGAGSLSGGIDGYIPIWSGSTALSNSFLNQSGDVLKTTYSGSDTGLKIDFANQIYQFGDLNSADHILQVATFGISLFSNGAGITGTNNVTTIGDIGYKNSTRLSVDDTNQIIKTSNQSVDKGLKLDFASGSYQLGNFNSGSITITGSQVQITGSLSIASEFTLDETLTKFAKYTNVGTGVANDITLFSIPTGSYTSAFGKYTIYSGSNSRAGELMTSRNDTTINYTDVATNDIGSTSAVKLNSQVSQSYYEIIVSFPATGTWDIKMMATYI